MDDLETLLLVDLLRLVWNEVKTPENLEIAFYLQDILSETF